jgi:hypothetical protein
MVFRERGENALLLTDRRVQEILCGGGLPPSGAEMLALQARLAEEHGYRAIPLTFETGDIRAMYRRYLPEWCCETGADELLATQTGMPVAAGYLRIVIGDYGAFVEFSPQQAIRENLKVQPGQGYRLTDAHYAARCKYDWLTARDTSGCKIYYQRRTVPYADYRPGLLYISPYEVFPAEKNE